MFSLLMVLMLIMSLCYASEASVVFPLMRNYYEQHNVKAKNYITFNGNNNKQEVAIDDDTLTLLDYVGISIKDDLVHNAQLLKPWYDDPSRGGLLSSILFSFANLKLSVGDYHNCSLLLYNKGLDDLYGFKPMHYFFLRQVDLSHNKLIDTCLNKLNKIFAHR